MSMAKAPVRQGFICIGILFVLIVFAVIFAILSSVANSGPKYRHPETAGSVSGAAQALRDTSNIASAVRSSQNDGIDNSAADAPPTDTPAAGAAEAVDGADAADDAGEVISGILEGL